jgi:hypothetical protein
MSEQYQPRHARDAYEPDELLADDVELASREMRRQFRESFRGLPWELAPVSQSWTSRYEDPSLNLAADITARLNTPYREASLPPGLPEALIEFRINTRNGPIDISSDAGQTIQPKQHNLVGEIIRLVAAEPENEPSHAWFVRACQLLSAVMDTPQDVLRTSVSELLSAAPTIYENQQLSKSFHDGSFVFATRELQTTRLHPNPLLAIAHNHGEVRHLSIKQGTRRAVFDNIRGEEVVFRDYDDPKSFKENEIDEWQTRIRREQDFERQSGLMAVTEGKLRTLSRLIDAAVASGVK